MIGLRSNPRRRRYREILSVLSRHGLGAFVNEAGWGRVVVPLSERLGAARSRLRASMACSRTHDAHRAER